MVTMVDAVPREGPKWLAEFLKQRAYFSECNEHIHSNARSKADQSANASKKSDRNFFCVDCARGPLCDAGRQSEHRGHHTLQVRKASHTDAIRVNDIQKLVDVSQIQNYTINGAKIVFLPSRPQRKPAKGSLRNCDMCNRSLQDQVRFCSLSCKLECILAHTDDTSLTFRAGAVVKGSNNYLAPAPSGEHEASYVSMSDENGVSDLCDLMVPMSPTSSAPKKRARSTVKHPKAIVDQEVDRPPMIPKVVGDFHVRGLTGMNMRILSPQSPTSVLHPDSHLIQESSNPGSAEPESSSSQGGHDSVEVMSFRKRPRKGIPFRAPMQ